MDIDLGATEDDFNNWWLIIITRAGDLLNLYIFIEYSNKLLGK